jgi:DNA-binding response OmpR family regulator
MVEAPLRGARILIVEDEAIIALELKYILTEAGACVIGPARTMEAALRLAHNPDLAAAVLDVQVGPEPVFAVAKRLAQRHVPFIFHTGHANRERLSSGWPEALVLTKPATSEELVLALARLVLSDKADRTTAA